MNTQHAFTIKTHSEAETEALGAALARLIRPGSVIALRGDLAAGKTCLVRGMARALAGDAAVHSPTFTLVNEYGSPPVLYHFDLYRLRGPDELFALGYEERFDGAAIAAVEWAERAENLLPARRVEIAMRHAGGDVREISIHDAGCMADGWRHALAARG